MHKTVRISPVISLGVVFVTCSMPSATLKRPLANVIVKKEYVRVFSDLKLFSLSVCTVNLSMALFVSEEEWNSRSLW